jgi:hypothetical protein
MPHVGPQIRLCNGADGSPVMPSQAARSRRASPEPPTSLMSEIFTILLRWRTRWLPFPSFICAYSGIALYQFLRMFDQDKL